jgi:hypothetical protein
MTAFSNDERLGLTGSLRTFQALMSRSLDFSENSVRLSIAIGRILPGGRTQELDLLDTGAASPRGFGDPGFQSSLDHGPNTRMNTIAALTHEAWTAAAVFLSSADHIATGTIQVDNGFGQFVDHSIVVRQINNVLHIDPFGVRAPGDDGAV